MQTLDLTMFTNVTKMPDILHRALIRVSSKYDRGKSDVTVTELIDPPQIVRLKHAHRDEIVEDTADLIYRAMGSTIHAMIEKEFQAQALEASCAIDPATLPEGITLTQLLDERTRALVGGWLVAKERACEERFYADFKVGMLHARVGGQIDYYQDGSLVDWKLVSVWEVIHGLKPEKVAQLNMLAYLMESDEFVVDRLFATCMMRDWSVGKARKDPKFPQKQVQTFEVEKWDTAITERYIHERLAAHGILDAPECTVEERWSKGAAFAVMKKGGKAAISGGVKHTRDEAEKMIESHPIAAQLYIEERSAERTRCLDYCAVAPFCPQWNKELEEAGKVKNSVS